MIKFAILPAAAALLLAGCMPPPPQTPAYEQPISQMPVEPQPIAGVSGLEERKPDLCGAEDFAQYVSQPASVIPTIGLSKEYRVVEYRGIGSQDYDPNRIVFQLDATGNIASIGCG